MRPMTLAWLAEALGAKSARRGDRIQALWNGYGELYRVHLDDGRTVVVKEARPPPGVADDVSFRRKCGSYDVELAFYRTVAARCDDTCRVPRLLASRSEGRSWLLVLEDLDAVGFTVRVDDADDDQLATALRWLASFHARFLGKRIPGVWPRGSYWQLETRRDELARMRPELHADAETLARILATTKFQTLLHGDPKEANFVFTPDGARVAAVDFQYTGHGCGMVDVAYLLHPRTDSHLLDTYFAALARPDVEAEWRPLFPVARRDFQRFLAGWLRG